MNFSGLVEINVKLSSGFDHLTDSASVVLLKEYTIIEETDFNIFKTCTEWGWDVFKPLSLQTCRVFLPVNF